MNEELKNILEEYTDFKLSDEYFEKFEKFYCIGKDKNDEILKLFKNAQDGRLIFNAQTVNKNIDKIDKNNELSVLNDVDKLYGDLCKNNIPSANLIAHFVKNLKIDKNGKIHHPTFKNQKFGRVVSNFIKSVAIAEQMTEEELNIFLRKYVQGVWAEKKYLNDDEVLVLSINPIDFLTCSNGNSWTSCMNYKNGDYKSTIFNYLTMNSAIIAFIAKKDNLLTKICRSWVYIDSTGVAVQHEYPKHDSLLLPYAVMGVLNQKPLPDDNYKITYKNKKNEGYIDLTEFGRAIVVSSSPRMIVDLSSKNLCLECLNETENNDICSCCSLECHRCDTILYTNDTNDYVVNIEGETYCTACAEDVLCFSDCMDGYIHIDYAVYSEYEESWLPEDEADLVNGDWYLKEDIKQCECCGCDIAPDMGET